MLGFISSAFSWVFSAFCRAFDFYLLAFAVLEIHAIFASGKDLLTTPRGDIFRPKRRRAFWYCFILFPFIFAEPLQCDPARCRPIFIAGAVLSLIYFLFTPVNPIFSPLAAWSFLSYLLGLLLFRRACAVLCSAE